MHFAQRDFALRFLSFFVAATVLCPLSGCRRCVPDPNESVLYANLGARIGTLDPGDIGDISGMVVAGQCCECLYQYHYLKRPYEIIPQLAAALPAISGDGLTCTIKIAKGVYFADDACFDRGKGRELTAHDFVFAWKRIADVKERSRNWWIFDNRIVGLDEFREYTKSVGKNHLVDYSRPVAGLRVPDDHTLVIRLKRPWPGMIYHLAYLPTSAIAKEAVDYYGEDIISHPVGTGPFRLKTWHRGSYVEMVRNDSFRKELYPFEGEQHDLETGLLADAGKALPIVDKLFFVLVEEDQPRWLQFMRGRIDAMSIPKDSYTRAVDGSGNLNTRIKELGIRMETFSNPDTSWIGFNMEDEILGPNKPLRLAISYCLDREGYIELFSNGRDQTAYGFIPVVLNGYDPQVNKIGIGYDPEKAVQLVKEAQELNGGKLPRLKLSMPGTSTTVRQTGQFWQRCFAAVGLDCDIEYMDWPTFQEKVKNRDVQMFWSKAVAFYPDAEYFLGCFYGKHSWPGPNIFNYANGRFDEIYEQIVSMPDGNERTQLCRQAQRIVIEDCPAAFVSHRVAYVLMHDWVHNYKAHAFGYGLAKYRRIDVSKRAAYKQLLKKVR